MRSTVLGLPLWQEHAVAAADSPGRRGAAPASARGGALQAPLPAAISIGPARRISSWRLLHVLPPLLLSCWPPLGRLWLLPRRRGLLLPLLQALLPRVVLVEYMERPRPADVPQAQLPVAPACREQSRARGAVRSREDGQGVKKHGIRKTDCLAGRQAGGLGACIVVLPVPAPCLLSLLAARGAPVTSCHSLAGDHATAHTAARCPLSVCVKPPDTMSHSMTCRQGGMETLGACGWSMQRRRAGPRTRGAAR